MTTQDRDYEDLIRGALCAAAESIEPVGDGLQKIRHRLSSPRSARSMLAGFTGWLLLYRIRLSVRLEPVTAAGQSALGQLERLVTGTAVRRGAGGRRTAPPRPAHGRLGAARPWLRPALAVSAVVAVVVAGFVTLHTVQPTVVTRNNSLSSPGPQPGGGQPDTVASPGLWQPPLGVNPSQPVTGTSHKTPVFAAPVVACTPTPTPIPSPRKSKKPAPTPRATPSSVSPTPTPKDTSSATPTPTPTDTGGSPSATPSPTGPSATSGASRGATAADTALVTIPGVTPRMVTAPCGGAVSPKPSVPRL
jgi:outer membrane biosynthesis protein TonB